MVHSRVDSQTLHGALVIAAVMWAVVSLSGCGYEGKKSAEEYITEAERLISEAKPQDAVIELKNALRLEPESAQARWLIADQFLVMGDYVSAISNYERALQNGVEEASVYPPLARAMLHSGQFRKLLELPIKPSFPYDTRADLMAIRSLALNAQGNNKEAVKYADEALQISGGRVYPLFAKASLEYAEKNYSVALSLLQDVLELDSQFISALVLKGDIHSIQGEREIAEALYSRAVDNSVVIGNAHIRRARHYLNQKEYALAAEDIAYLRAAGVSTAVVEYMSGIIKLSRNDHDAARTHFNKALELAPGHIMSIYFLAYSHMQTESSLASMYAENVFSKAPNFVPGRLLFANLRLKEKDYKAAEDLLRPLYEARPTDLVTANLLVISLVNQDRQDEAAKILEPFIQKQPEFRGDRLRLGASLFAVGLEDQGSELIAELQSEDKKDPLANIWLAQAELATKGADEALSTAQAWISEEPTSASAHNLVGLIFLTDNQFDKAKASFRKAIEHDSDGNTGASLNLARMLIGLQQLEEAKETLYEFEAKHGEHSLAKLLYAQIAVSAWNLEEVKQNLRAALRMDPKLDRARIPLAEILLNQGDKRGALELLQSIDSKEYESPSVSWLLARTYYENEDFSRSAMLLERLRAAHPNLIQVHTLLLKIYEKQKRTAEFEHGLDEIIRVQPGNPMANILKAHLALRKGQIDEAKDFLARSNLDGNHPARLELEAKIAFIEHDIPTAVSKGAKLLELDQNASNALFQARAISASGRPEDAKRLLSEWLLRAPRNLALHIEQANLLQRTGEPEAYEATLWRILEIDSENVYALNNLAWYLTNREPLKALDFAERAYLLAPRSIAVIDTLSNVQLLNHRNSDALSTIEKGVKLNGASYELRLTFAKALIQNKRPDEARNQLDNILSGDAPPEIRRQAKELFEHEPAQ